MGNNDRFSGCTISPPHCKCLDKLTKEELDLIESKSVYIDFKKDEVICKMGSLSSHIMMVEEGLIKVFIQNETDSLVLKIVTKGNLLGLSSLREDSKVFSYSAMAYTNVRIKQIDIHTFYSILKQNPVFALEIINIMAANSELVQNRFFSLHYKQSYGRMADIILCLSNRVFKNMIFDLPISKKELAELTGMTAETAIRILKKFEKDGLVSMKGKSFEILDIDRLINISEMG